MREGRPTGKREVPPYAQYQKQMNFFQRLRYFPIYFTEEDINHLIQSFQPNFKKGMVGF